MIIPLGSGIDIFLNPGECYFGERGVRIRTTLGSCVAFTLWHPQKKMGGMCHYMLPSRFCRGSELDGRYADEAMCLLEREVRAVGTRLAEYEVKLFGGARMFGGSLDNSVAVHNIATAHALLLRYGLRPKTQSLGGIRYRQLLFDIATGDVWVRRGEATPAAKRAGVSA